MIIALVLIMAVLALPLAIVIAGLIDSVFGLIDARVDSVVGPRPETWTWREWEQDRRERDAA